MNKINLGRNEICHCGSGIKYKRCCLEKDSAEELAKSYQLFKSAYLEEDDPGLLAFHEFFPDIAEKENRVFWPIGYNEKKREPLQIIEYYCATPKCDCNRVVVAVLDREKPEQGTILSVGFAFDRKDPDPGPYIDPLNPLTAEGKSVYPFIKNMLDTDFEYVARLKRHYDLVKGKIKSKGRARKPIGQVHLN